MNRQQRDRQAEKRREQHREYLARIARHRVADELQDIVEDAATFADSADNRREVVVQEHHVRRFPRSIGALLAHCHTDVGAFERRCIINAVAGHCDELTMGLQGFDDVDLLCRVDASIDARIGDTVGELGFCHCRKFGSRQDVIAIVGNPYALRDRQCRSGMIARNHHRGDPG